MTRRQATVYSIAHLVGADTLVVQDVQDGWPALAELHIDGETVPVALFAGTVGLSGRGRDRVERRFQNPGQNRPVVLPAGRYPLLIGLWEHDLEGSVHRPVLVCADPRRREGLNTRHSIFVPLLALQEAAMTGWSEATSGSGETIRCLLPPLLPTAAAADRLGIAVPAAQLQLAAVAAGLTSGPALVDTAVERARRATMSLVRDARFSGRVVAAYNHACAMCGLGLGLVQGAHILPVAARAMDEPWNGLALCANHHLAFDRHLVAVDPQTYEIRYDRTTLAAHTGGTADSRFVEASLPRLTLPSDHRLRPRPEMFEERYRYFAGCYEWIRGQR